jgi:ribose/xylose/arabinose/galactoside ABC-type transport system permease subunit
MSRTKRDASDRQRADDGTDPAPASTVVGDHVVSEDLAPAPTMLQEALSEHERVNAEPAPRGRRWYGIANIGAVYVWIVIIIVFWAVTGSTFGSIATVQFVLNDNAVTGLVALSVIMPLAAGVYDLSVGYTLGLTSIVVSALLSNTAASPLEAILVGLGVALVIGVVNATIVVKLRIDSFIATLATSSLLQALIIVVSNNQDVTSARLLGPFAQIAQANVGGITAPVFYMVGAALVLWFVLEHTPTGRYLYAIGFGRETARLSGIRTDRLRFMTLVVSALVAGAAGVVLTAKVTAGSPTIGPPYLLPAYAAAFVGATQLRGGRFNALGTLIAVLLIGTGTTGLAFANTPIWAPSVFVGVTLIIAVGLTGVFRPESRS